MDIKLVKHPLFFLVLIFGLTSSCVSGVFLYQAEQQAITRSFQKQIDEKANALYREVVVSFEALTSLEVLFSQEKLPSFEAFRRESQKVMKRNADIRALEWIPRVRHEERQIYQQQQQQMFPRFEFTERKSQGVMVTAANREEYYPVYYIEPLTTNTEAFGFDLASNTKRIRTLYESRDKGVSVITGAITLVQEKLAGKGFLALVPVYKGNTETIEHRRSSISGFVLGVYLIKEIFNNSALANKIKDVDIKLIDNSSNNELLFSQLIQDSPSTLMNIHYQKKLPKLWGRQWSLLATPTENFYSKSRGVLPIVVFSFGILFTLMTLIYTKVLLMRTLAVQSMLSQLNRANRKLSFLSQTDGLTKIANRRYLDLFITREWSRAIRNRSCISLIMIDIDFFKKYNDNYGHLEGDKVLKQVAKALNLLVKRPGDVVARYGGEEFALVLPDTKDAAAIAKKCRAKVESLGIRHLFSSVSDVVTVSVGYCSIFPQKDQSSEIMIKRADEALFDAKKEGRNKVR